jgi:predicted metal-dependent RNase
MQIATAEGFSGHSDRRQLIAWVKNLNQKPKRIFTMHGTYAKTQELASTLSKIFNVQAEAPLNLEARRLK